ncbi:hypothetical protein B7463_g10511, partial [Scytalidium lignicola]
MKAICKNVEEFLDDNNLAIGAGMAFHYDGNSMRAEERGDDSCPRSWQNVIGTPCGSVTGQPNVMPGNLPPRVGPILNANGQTVWSPQFGSEIPNLAGNGPSGMRFTCDEFPAKSWIEGGVNGLQPYTSIYCAPKRVSCSAQSWNRVLAQFPNYPDVASEQDWQGRAHNLLGQYAKRRASPTPNPIMKFMFTTTAIGTGSTAAQVVLPSFINAGGATIGAATTAALTGRSLTKPQNECTGEFCEELLNAGFDFVHVPPHPTPSYDILDIGTISTEIAKATIHIIV